MLTISVLFHTLSNDWCGTSLSLSKKELLRAFPLLSPFYIFRDKKHVSKERNEIKWEAWIHSEHPEIPEFVASFCRHLPACVCTGVHGGMCVGGRERGRG